VLTNAELRQAIANLNLLINEVQSPASYFRVENHHVSKSLFSEEQSKIDLQIYLQSLIHAVTEAQVYDDNPLFTTFFISLQYFFHLEPNTVVTDLGLDFSSCPALVRTDLKVAKLPHSDPDNYLPTVDLPPIQYDTATKRYTSPDDDRAHLHREEAARIFTATQIERFKALLHAIFAKLGIYIFETARYEEHNYLESDIYRQDSAISPVFQTEQPAAEVIPPLPTEPDYLEDEEAPLLAPPQVGVQIDTAMQAIERQKKEQVPTHYWIGHASNFITIPTDSSPLTVLTDPVEGDLAPLLYPRMTKAGKLIDGTFEDRLPKVDIVIISHNHRDHVCETTLKCLVKQQPKMIVPEGDEALFLGLGFTNVVSVQWWEQVAITNAQHQEVLRVTAVPARHWSGRGIADAHSSAFNGYVLSSEKLAGDVYFAGDTALMDDSLSDPIFTHFNVVTSIQPGGPDEGRSDMESTHQSSADAILMHFKILAKRYQKLQQSGQPLTIEAFWQEIQNIKTIYNHTATFKLGNLRLRDSFYSYHRVIAAFQQGAEWSTMHLPAHEQQVVAGIWELAQTMTFENKALTNAQIAEIILFGIVMPKIGQRQALYFTEPSAFEPSFSYRSLITNGRALEEFDALVRGNLSNGIFLPNMLISDLLAAYLDPWHAQFSRTHQGIQAYINDLGTCHNADDMLAKLDSMESELNIQNQQGHMQSLIHYAKWIVQFSNPFQDEQSLLAGFRGFFTCQSIRKLVDQESQHTGKIGLPSRAEKQRAFQTLSTQLAELPTNVTTYGETIANWLSSKADGLQSIKTMLQTNRSSFFMQSKTHSAEVVEQLEALTH